MLTQKNEDEFNFLGSISIPLLRLSEALEVELEKHGLRIPVMKGEKGHFDIYNLMGRNIGTVYVSYRIYCLGSLAVQHIPKAMSSSDLKSNEHVTSNVLTKDDNQELMPSQHTDSVKTPPHKTEVKSSHSQTSKTEVFQIENLVLAPKLEKSKSAVSEIQTSPEQKAADGNPPLLFYRRTVNSDNSVRAKPDPGAMQLKDMESSFQRIFSTDSKGIQSEKPASGSYPSFPILEALYKELAKAGLSFEAHGMPEKRMDSNGTANTKDDKHAQSGQAMADQHVQALLLENRRESAVQFPSARRVQRPKSSILHQSRAKKATDDEGIGHHHNKRLCEMRISHSIPPRKSWIRAGDIPKPTSRPPSKLEYGLTSTYLARLRSSNPALFETLSLNESQLKLQTYNVDRTSLQLKERTHSKQCKRRAAAMSCTGRHSRCFNKSLESNVELEKSQLRQGRGNKKSTSKKTGNKEKTKTSIKPDPIFEQSSGAVAETLPENRKGTTVVKILPMVELEETFEKEQNESVVLGNGDEDNNYELEFEDYEVESDFEVESPQKDDGDSPLSNRLLNGNQDKKTSSELIPVHISTGNVMQTEVMVPSVEANQVEKSFDDFAAGFEQESDHDEFRDSRTSFKSENGSSHSDPKGSKSHPNDSKESTYTYSTSDNVSSQKPLKLQKSQSFDDDDYEDHINTDEKSGKVVKTSQQSKEGKDWMSELLSSSLDQNKMRELLDMRHHKDTPVKVEDEDGGDYSSGSGSSSSSSHARSKIVNSKSTSSKSNLSSTYKPTFGKH